MRVRGLTGDVIASASGPQVYTHQLRNYHRKEITKKKKNRSKSTLFLGKKSCKNEKDKQKKKM